MQMIYDWMGNVACFFIFLSAVVHFVPEETYGKYIRYFMGLMFLLLLFIPFLQIFDQKEFFDETFSSYMEDAEDAGEKWRQYGQELEAEYESRYQETMIESEEEDHADAP